MVFSSIEFLFYFLPTFLVVYVLLPWRNLTPLAFSLFFYFWGEGYHIAIMLVTILLNWGFGRALERRGRHSKAILLVGVSLNLMVLLAFKYSGFMLNEILRVQVDVSNYGLIVPRRVDERPRA